MSEKIFFYKTKEPYGEFSNFARFPIIVDGVVWPTSEHYYQAQKWVGYPERYAAILKALTPKEAARLGRMTDWPIRLDWEEVKEGVMLKALRAKFLQHESLRKLLCSTGNAEIHEHADVDHYWADGGDGSGKSRLGVLLMAVRAECLSRVQWRW